MITRVWYSWGSFVVRITDAELARSVGNDSLLGLYAEADIYLVLLLLTIMMQSLALFTWYPHSADLVLRYESGVVLILLRELARLVGMIAGRYYDARLAILVGIHYWLILCAEFGYLLVSIRWLVLLIQRLARLVGNPFAAFLQDNFGDGGIPFYLGMSILVLSGLVLLPFSSAIKDETATEINFIVPSNRVTKRIKYNYSMNDISDPVVSYF
ncbi:Hypothetical predicted protein [Mytilus galloprovincialis]|uniref:Uncharacterized protein n=1 Tax=Mytilus galloprovincialis TaxID=29158 RepID=A0A8B6DHF3_MYTGA|nr:Hypothetical predicted protein [Mytilus galloprovincialis]